MGITPMGAERLLSRGCPARLPGSDGPRALISTGNAIGLLEYRTATFAPKLPRVHTFTEGGETPSDRRGCVGNHGRAQESARVLKGEAEVAVGSWSTRLAGGRGSGWSRPGAGRGTGTPAAWCRAAGHTLQRPQPSGAPRRVLGRSRAASRCGRSARSTQTAVSTGL